MTDRKTLDLDAVEKPLYEIQIGGKSYGFDPFLMAIALEGLDTDTKELSSLCRMVADVLDAGKLGEVPELTPSQCLSVLADFSAYFEGVQKKMIESLGLPASTDTSVDEAWLKAQGSAKPSSGSDSTSANQKLGPPGATTSTEPLEPMTTPA